MGVTFEAVQKPLMPKGVEHVVSGVGIEYAKRFQVQKPLMPKGVEHWYKVMNEYTRYVQKPLMPKGVEHTAAGCSPTPWRPRVQKPLMPKGVEHLRAAPAVHRMLMSAETFDAERR